MSAPAIAAHKHKRGVQAPAPLLALDEPHPIDLIRQELFRREKSKNAKAVGKAFDALNDKKFDLARKLAARFRKDELFADYSIAITAASYRDEGIAAYDKKEYAKAAELARKSIPLFLRVESDFPYSSLLKKLPEELAKAEIALADALHGQKQWKAAQEIYNRAFQRLSPVSLAPVEPEALGRYAETCAKARGMLCEAWVQRFVAIYPKGSEEIKAVAKFLPEANEKAKPTRAFTRLTQVYKGTDLDQASFDKAMQTYIDGSYGKAIKGFQQFLDEFPKSSLRYRARYWLAQALTQDQDHDKARRVYDGLIREAPLSYYGLLATIASGKDIDAFIDGSLPQAMATDPFLQPYELVRLKRAERFAVEGVNELAASELRELKPRESLSNPFLLYLAALNSEVGNHSTSFQLLSELISRGYEGVYSSYGVRLVFPVEYLDLIQKYSKAANVDPVLTLSLIKQESAFDADAMSWVGATGLMQVMPATAVETEPSIRRADLLEAETNIRVGTKYLRKLLDRFNGNIVFALASYNAGPNATLRWIREGRSKQGMVDFIESIPYRETRDYVASIVRNYFWYSRKLNGDAPKGLSYFWNMYGPPELPPTEPGNAPEARERKPADTKKRG